MTDRLTWIASSDATPTAPGYYLWYMPGFLPEVIYCAAWPQVPEAERWREADGVTIRTAPTWWAAIPTCPDGYNYSDGR